ncbi:TPA: ead/Ea22-like family protein [Raoultella ornithinolytica]
MTDITELAQSLENAASKALIEEGLTWFSEEQLSHEDGIALHKADAEFVAVANPANVLALVEALEKAQAQSSKWLEAYHKAVSIGARYEERIAELESRTVTVKLPELCVGVVQSGHAVMVPYAGGHWFNKTAILEMLTAAGIKWEAE